MVDFIILYLIGCITVAERQELESWILIGCYNCLWSWWKDSSFLCPKRSQKTADFSFIQRGLILGAFERNINE